MLKSDVWWNDSLCFAFVSVNLLLCREDDEQIEVGRRKKVLFVKIKQKSYATIFRTRSRPERVSEQTHLNKYGLLRDTGNKEREQGCPYNQIIVQMMMIIILYFIVQWIRATSIPLVQNTWQMFIMILIYLLI